MAFKTGKNIIFCNYSSKFDRPANPQIKTRKATSITTWAEHVLLLSIEAYAHIPLRLIFLPKITYIVIKNNGSLSLLNRMNWRSDRRTSEPVTLPVHSPVNFLNSELEYLTA